MKLSQTKVDEIRLDGGTQPRSKIDQDTIAEYVEAILAGDEFPPVDVFNDGKDLWLADGFHRWHAYRGAKKETIPTIIHQGTLRDAVLFSVSANSTHGMRRTNADKRRAVERLLKDPEWAAWSNQKIAQQCAVSPPFVATCREGLSINGLEIDDKPGKPGEPDKPKTPATPTRTATRGGKTYKMKTANIGGKSACPNCGATERDEDGDCAKCKEPAKKPARKATDAETAKAQVKVWADTIGRWLGKSPSIDEYRDKWPGKLGDAVVKHATDLYESLKAWQKAIK